MNGHNSFVNSVCFSPDGQILASGSADNSIRFWDIKRGKEFFSSKNSNQNQLNQQTQNNFKKNKFKQSKNATTNYFSIQRISQQLLFEASGAQIFKGEFINYKGVNLLQLFKSQGTLILENLDHRV